MMPNNTCGACGSSTDMTSKQQIVGVQIIFVVNYCEQVSSNLFTNTIKAD